jgi:hypothetical protein
MSFSVYKVSIIWKYERIITFEFLFYFTVQLKAVFDSFTALLALPSGGEVIN